MVAHWIRSHSRRTAQLYLADLRHYSRFRGGDVAAAIVELLDAPGTAHELATAWAYAMRALAPATIGRRLATLRSLVRAAGELGIVTWSLRARGPRVVRQTDVRGPPTAYVENAIRLLEAQAALKPGPRRSQRIAHALAVRDLAIVLTLYDCALRRAELVALELEDLDQTRAELAVVGKGTAGQRMRWPASRRAMAAIAAWLEVRGREPGPLFRSLHRTRQRMHPDRVRVLVLDRVGCSPHALRHTAGTRLAELTGDAYLVRTFLRHRSLETSLVYLDATDDAPRRAVELVAGELELSPDRPVTHPIERKPRK